MAHVGRTPHDEVEAVNRVWREIGEILRVHKERISRGEVRLRKEVVTEHQNIEVPRTREELVVERIPGSGREATGAKSAQARRKFAFR